MGIKNINLNGVESTNNKQDDLSIDGTGTKYPTVDAVNTANDLKLDKKLLADETWDLNYKMLNTINAKKTETSLETTTTDTRPVVEEINYSVNPSSPLVNKSDFHGLDMVYRTAGNNINTNVNIYGIETQVRNYQPAKMGAIRPFYALGQNSNGGATEINPILAWSRNTGSGTVDIVRGIYLRATTNTGGGTITNNYGIFIEDFGTVATGENYCIKSLGKNFFQKIEVADTGVVANLNAEKVGGVLGIGIVAGTNATKTTPATDANNILSTGLYTLRSTATNTPYASEWSLVCIQINNSLNYFSQTIHDMLNGEMFTRAIANGTPQPWMQVQNNKSGTTAQRPAQTTIGLMYFDTTIGKPIWYNGTNWIDSVGTTV